VKKCVPYLLTVLGGVADLNRFSLRLMSMKRTMFLFLCSSMPQSPTRRRQLCGVVRVLWSLIDAFFPQIAIAKGFLLPIGGEGDEPLWQIGRGLQGAVDVVPLRAIVVHYGWGGG